MPKTTERITGLSEREKSTITNGLRVAAEKFEENAKFIRTELNGPRTSADARERVATQFDQQAAESRAIIERIDGQDEQDERDQSALCGECGAEMLADLASTVNTTHTRNCSRHPINIPLTGGR